LYLLLTSLSSSLPSPSLWPLPSQSSSPSLKPSPAPDLGHTAGHAADVFNAVVIPRRQDVTVKIGGMENRNRVDTFAGGTKSKRTRTEPGPGCC
jgi:hypothetical protein